MDLIPREIIERRDRLESYIAEKESHVQAVIAQKIGPEWSFKVLTEHPPAVPSIYFEGTPVIFERSKKRLSKR